jgi:PAS domain-containing protein
MIQPINFARSVLLPGPAALRELARAFGHITDFRRFTEMLEQALGKAGFFEEAQIQLFEEAPPAGVFAAGQLTLPLAGRGELHGVLRVSGGTNERSFGPEDIHLLSALGAVISAAMDHALRHGELRSNLEIMSFVANLAPVGLLATDGEGRVLLANDLALRWLGAETIEAVAARLAPETLGVDWGVATRFHLRVDGKLIYGEARTAVAAGEHAAQARTLVLTDLTAEQVRLMDGLQREIYRCRWLGQKLSFVLVESAGDGCALLQSLPDLRALLSPGELAGPYDATRIGLVLPESDRAQVLARLRAWVEKMPGVGLRAALVVSTEASAERVIGQALEAMQPVATLLRRVLLLHDDYPAVNDMLAMVLGRDYDIVKSSKLEDSMALLRSRSFDALVTEVELRAGGSGVDLALLAKQLQPSILPFFTTVTHAGKMLTEDPLLADHVVIRKPFDVRQLERTVRESLS